MSLSRLRRWLLPLLLAGTGAIAQLESAPQPIDMEPSRAYDEEAPYEGEDVPYEEEVPEAPVREAPVREAPARAAPPVAAPAAAPTGVRLPPSPPVQSAPAKAAAPEAAKAPDAAEEKPSDAAPSVRAPPSPIIVPTAGDADLQAAFARWRQANVDLDPKGADAAQRELISLKEDLGIEGLDAFGYSFARAADAKVKGNDPAGAVALATAAVQLAPDLPATHLSLARSQFASDPSAVGEYVDAVGAALSALLRDPRYLRPAIADLLTALVFAVLATAAAVTLVMFARRARYFFHDFHHLFPKAASRWQSSAIALLLLSLPFVFRLGIGPILLVLFGAVALYLSARERLVAAALIASLGVLPLLGGLAVERTAFAGTPAEDLQQLEQGGLPAASAAARVLARSAGGDARFPELFALGRYELRRGRLDEAVKHFKAAAALRANDARVLTNLANALFAQGDPDSAADIYKSAAQADPALAAPLYNVSRLYNRRAAVAPDAEVGAENDRAYTALTTAQKIDPVLLYRKDPPDDRLVHNRLLISPPLPDEEIEALAQNADAGRRVRAQLGLMMLGTAAEPLLFVYPGLIALLLLAFGFSAPRFQAAKACEKCGRAVCRRCDPELGMGSQLCNQCVNVFARKGAVAPPVRVRKQMEVDRYQGRMDRISYAFGLICSGAGHIFSGLPLRGAAYAFLFLFLIFNAFFRMGVLRPPFGVLPEVLRLLPIGVVFLFIYLLSLRGLFKRQSE